MKKIIAIVFALFIVGLTANAQTQTPPKKAKLNKAATKNKMLVAAESQKAKAARNKPKTEGRKEGE